MAAPLAMPGNMLECYDPGYVMPEAPPLCKELYLRLQARFGTVKVASQGEEMTGSIVSDPTNGRRYWSVATWGETYRVNCKFCNDTRYRLWISHRFGQPNPADPRRPSKFYGICFNEDCLQQPGNREELFDLVWGVRNRNITHEPPVITPGLKHTEPLREVAWPGAMTPLWRLDDRHPAWVYMAGDRGFDRNTAVTYNLHFCTEASAAYPLATNRIVAPFTQFGMMVGWQGRYTKDPPPRGVPKYYTMPGMAKRCILYNHDRSKDHPFVVVFEGITDVWRFGDPSVAICGKTMSTGQRLLLQRTWLNKPLVICLDPEARDESAGILHELNRSNANPVVNVTLQEGWDPALYETRALWDTIYSQARQIGVELPELR